MKEDAGGGAPGDEPGLPPGTGEKAQGANAAGAVADGGVVQRRGVRRGRSRTAVLIRVITWATRCSGRLTEGTGRTDGRGPQATGREALRGRQEKEMVQDRRRESMEQETGKGTRRIKKGRGHGQQ